MEPNQNAAEAGGAAGDPGDRPAGHMPDVWARMHAELERQHAELDRIRAVLAGLTAEATSPTGDVAVTVNARGLLVGLTIAPSALRDRDATTLAGLITSLVAAADEKLRATRDQVSMSIVDGPEVTSPGYDDIVDVVRG
ncbi:YbaB/EbfC family nucleoid-associated protein [Gordonia sp. (in: high G+C Gram-positive bacteria)]|uniref:YbaB/EbfC family nucleoid-associated protein n=1 Tax=Gordonia sp. (in: high G+C Gram-positive bacteria) TaxID=84139 RepID=UPI0025BD083F|nr:YbaB/EbfC family nucleoid-associated protein [Gordonia sp. (in: high G+C Gram-positive bacteria)]HMS76864.1 YbaB/EbfC family nucleoid-associated protein [Gordonia sp. (in: high G+C Gram-positive bacteria)]HQV19943.1 YbaB/EbfC family nucleoid-associated protein [Gordonia sp. (in: high G+C Gram-positive bacteria)]